MLKTREILTPPELSEYLHVHKATIYRALREGTLPGFRVGNEWRFRLDAIEQWQRDQVKHNARAALKSAKTPAVGGPTRRARSQLWG
jgi:excisionase family DNA binding protein